VPHGNDLFSRSAGCLVWRFKERTAIENSSKIGDVIVSAISLGSPFSSSSGCFFIRTISCRPVGRITREIPHKNLANNQEKKQGC
jgi:hypothetical protein